MRIAFRHILPNTMGIFLVLSTAQLGSAVLVEATLLLGPVSKSGWLLSWGDCLVRVMIADDQGCELRSER